MNRRFLCIKRKTAANVRYASPFCLIFVFCDIEGNRDSEKDGDCKEDSAGEEMERGKTEIAEVMEKERYKVYCTKN
jgi:hypothetical protein